MKTECYVVRDLLPLYVEDMVSPETAKYIRAHLAECAECEAEFEALKAEGALAAIEKKPADNIDDAKPFKKIMKRMNREFYMLSYSLIIFFVFLGFSWTGGENLMYNSLIMPVVGVFGYYVFKWKAIYKMPLLLLVIDMFLCVFNLVELDIYSAFLWTLIYSVFVFVGIIIAFLLHFALRKEKK